MSSFLSRNLLVACLFGSATLWSQAISTSQISGTVRDASGLAVPGADVKVTQSDTGLVRTATTAADGGFVLPNLPIGPYQIEVSKEGFSKYLQSGIVLQVASNPQIDVTLRVGSITEQVEVQANANLVETRNAGLGQVIDNQRVLELPLNGRQATELIYLSGMATPVNGAGLNSGVRNYPTVDISVAGGLSNGLTYALDGATHNDPYNNLNLPLPFPDALQEFKVETSALPAQYGHHSSAAVNGVTKSGTNAFHGGLFEFIRNGAVNARNTFSPTVDQLKRNQFGGTLGGPILQNKLFFFVGQQSTIQRTAPSLNIAYVPTQAMLNGDFSTIASPACNTSGRSITLAPSQGFVNNQISPALFSTPAMNILKQKSFPSTTDPCGQITFGRRTNSSDYNSLARVDYQIRDNHNFFGRYLLAKLDQPTDHDPNNIIVGSTASLAFQVTSIVLGDTYVIGAGTVSNFRASFNRAAVPKISPEFFSAQDVGINVWVAQPKFMRMSITNGFNIASVSETPSTYSTNEFQFSEDMSMVRGTHTIGFGVDWVHSLLNASSKLNAVGPFTFNGQVTGLGLADFMLGKPSSFTQATPTLSYSRMDYAGFYVQDSWRASSRLTVNGGLRWDPYIPVRTKYGWSSHFDQALFDQGATSAQYTKAPAGLIFPGDSGYPGTSFSNRRMNNFAPRIALAFDPKGDGRTSIRAAYGIFYDLPSHNEYVGFAQSPPFGNQTTVNFPASFANPWQGVAGGNPYPLTLSKDAPFVNYGSYENFLLNPRTTYSQQWNLSIQRQIGQDWLAQGNYIGTSIIHLWGGDQVNPAVYIPGGACTINGQNFNPCSTTANVNQRRRLVLQNPSQGIRFGSISQLEDGGTLSYEGLNLSLQRRRAKGVTVQANYTWSHCISDLHNAELSVAGSNFTIPQNRRADRGNCPISDRRHNFNLSAVYETPRFEDSTLRILATGWQISTIVRLLSGPYISVVSGLDQALTGQPSQRAAQKIEDPYAANRSLSLYLNPAAFAQPALGTYSGMGQFNVQAPGSVLITAGITRVFKVGENKSIQFRVESFNLPNHVNPGTPSGISGAGGLTATSAAINNPNFGRILSADDPRIFQGALKFVF
jgi:hypothetical protein